MTRANVLVVEDDDAIRRLLVQSLNQRSCMAVDGARDGRDALHQLLTKRYAVVVLDVMMPYMSGIDLLDSVKAVLDDPSLGTIDKTPAVIVLTGCTSDVVSDATIRERFPTMVHEVLRKPVDMETLTARIESLL